LDLAERRAMNATDTNNDWLADEADGQLSIDVYQDDHNIYILAPIAGVNASDVDLSITDEVITIKGTRKPGHSEPNDQHFTQECYWGPFSRSYVLPIAVNAENSKASLKDGLLTVIIPKDEKVKTRSIKINETK